MTLKTHRRTRALATAGVPLAVAGMGLLALAPPAVAASRDGVCNSGEFCYYYNSYEAGSVSDFTTSLDNYGSTQPTCYEFKGPGNGQGLCIKNNAASVWNRTGKSVTVYYNSDYGGAHQTIAAGTKANLNSTLKNNNASHHIGALTSEVPRDDYQGHYNLTYGFAYRNCTAFAAFRIVNRLHITGFKDYYLGLHWGDAGHWDNAARTTIAHNHGIRVNNTPTVGSIVVNDVHKVGHVAYVYKVNANGTFDVEEYNWKYENPGRYDTRQNLTISSYEYGFQHVIHFPKK